MDINWFTGGHSMTVGGQPAVKRKRRVYQLPTTDGRTVEAKVRSTFFDVYPTVDVAGTRYRLGPATPVVLRVVMLLPLVLLAGGGIGAFLGLTGVIVNGVVLRGPMSTGAKIALMIAVLGVAVVVWLVIAVVVYTATS
jgi:hypothetical protein